MELIYQLSDEARRRIFVEKGRDPGQAQSLPCDPAQLCIEDRQLLADINRSLSERVTLTLPMWERYGPGTRSFMLDAPPADGITLLALYRAQRAEAEKVFEAAREETIANRISQYMQWSGEREPNYDDFHGFTGSPRFDELKQAFETAKQRAREEATQLTASRARLEESKKAQQQARDAERAAWAREHGSSHLRKCIEGGYDCQRLYVLERAAKEFPDFTVDYNDAASWKPRSGPSERALDEAARVGGEAVWLMAEPSHALPSQEPDWDEPFEPCEAVVIQRYLDKYDLVKIV